MNPLLSVQNLTVAVGRKVLVDKVSFDVSPGKIVAIAGGSGSGKTTIGLAILRLLPPPLNITQGHIFFEGRNLLECSAHNMRQVRGGRIGMVFQEPLSALDPLFTIGRQLDEVLAAHTPLGPQDRRKKSLEALCEAGLTDFHQAYASYPHQLSGGMRQRAMVALACVCGPSLIIADEPTSSLDLTLQVRIMDLFKGFKKKNISILLIAHDLGMISHLADEVVILRAGQIVEKGPSHKVIAAPGHPYTQALVEAFQ